MDLYQAERLQEELARRNLPAQVRAAPDLWDLPGNYRTVVYPVSKGGERHLKIDMIEQAFHVLALHGTFVVLSPYEKDQFLSLALKKVFKRVHEPGSGMGLLFTCTRQGERPKRRHELTFQVHDDALGSLRFLSRPGVFSFGRLDNGARALIETMEINSGDHVLDLGCGCGTNGVFAGLRSGPDGFTVFADSNLRAAVLAEYNARSHGLERFRGLASSTIADLPDDSFHVVLANPPYYAQHSIAAMFIAEAWRLLRPGGKLYLVTKQPEVIGSLVIETFGDTEAVQKRGYHVLTGHKPAPVVHVQLGGKR
jgi:16S rRNA (guanine1207-N2)-methyltransferase